MNGVALQLLAPPGMSSDLEQLLKDLFGEPLNRLNQFQSEQVKRLQAKLQELAREALKDELADRKSTRLNSSHEWISYAVFCLKKKRQDPDAPSPLRPTYFGQQAST